MTEGTLVLKPGEHVYTTKVDGDDFGIDLVSPTRGTVHQVVREVRSVVAANGGRVVRFTDGTKSRPVHGRTAWLVAP